MKVFLSYSRRDSAVVQDIALALRGGGHKVFLGTYSLRAGGVAPRLAVQVEEPIQKWT